MKKFLGMMFHFVWNLQAYPFDFQLKTFCVAGLAWLSNPLAGTDFKDGVFGKVLLAEKAKNTCFRKIGIIDGYQHPNEKNY